MNSIATKKNRTPRTWLIDKRLKKNMTQVQVAQKAAIARSYINMLETGDRNPSVDVAKSVARVLGFSWTKFYE